MSLASTLVPKTAASYELKEISVFDIPESVRQRFNYCVLCGCAGDPENELQRYPVFKSDKPLYGSFSFGGTQRAPGSRLEYFFAIDESAGTGKGYDRIYIDANLNGDLTDDAPCPVAEDVPDTMRIQSDSVTAQAFFKPISLRVTPDDAPKFYQEFIPRFFAYGERNSYAALIPAKVRMGTIRIGWKKLDAVLGYSHGIPGSYDHPDTNLYLMPAGKPGHYYLNEWNGGLYLKALHRYAGTYYRLSATPCGDKLFVWPYQGPMGVFKVEFASRDINVVSVTGSLASKETTINLTEGLNGQNVPISDSYSLPVGDYIPLSLNIEGNGLGCSFGQNNHADGLPGRRHEVGPPIYAIKIRQDKPFVLDFSAEPKVIFALPVKGRRVRLGGRVAVRAVLIDPSLDIMYGQIRGENVWNPTVTITRANGEIVAEGVMPFG